METVKSDFLSFFNLNFGVDYANYASAITSQELRYIRDNWDFFKESVIFSISETIVEAPW
ncbi:MAG: hypothetical protein MJ179_06910 [Treponema sp.]|nr:hypothetical protein [Treponema sp.]